jgi:hypothetical protein
MRGINMNRCSFWFGKDVVLFNSTKSTQCKSIHLFIAYFHTYFFGKLPCGFTLINRLGKLLNITTVLLSLLRCWKTYKAEVVAVIIFVNKTVKSVIYFCKKKCLAYRKWRRRVSLNTSFDSDVYLNLHVLYLFTVKISPDTGSSF